jgi:hypothetical protein
MRQSYLIETAISQPEIDEQPRAFPKSGKPLRIAHGIG